MCVSCKASNVHYLVLGVCPPFSRPSANMEGRKSFPLHFSIGWFQCVFVRMKYTFETSLTSLLNVIIGFVFKYLHYKVFLHTSFTRLATACCKVPKSLGKITWFCFRYKGNSIPCYKVQKCYLHSAFELTSRKMRSFDHFFLMPCKMCHVVMSRD